MGPMFCTKRSASRRLGHKASIFGMAVCLVGVPFALNIVTETPSWAASPPPVATGTLIADEMQPGIQLIQTTFTATVSVPVPTVDPNAMNSLDDQITAEVANGQIGSDSTSIATAVVQAIDSKPLTYIVGNGQTQSETAQIIGFGTGWVITPDGYIVTADHVVDPAQTELKQNFAKYGLAKFSQQAAQTIAQGASNNGFTSSQVATLTDAVNHFLAANLSISNIKSSVTAQLGTAVTGLGKGTNPITVDVVSKGSPYPGR